MLEGQREKKHQTQETEFIYIIFILYALLVREGNGNPLQYSCLENPRDRGAWQATVHGVTEVLETLSN